MCTDNEKVTPGGGEGDESPLLLFVVKTCENIFELATETRPSLAFYCHQVSPRPGGPSILSHIFPRPPQSPQCHTSDFSVYKLGRCP